MGTYRILSGKSRSSSVNSNSQSSNGNPGYIYKYPNMQGANAGVNNNLYSGNGTNASYMEGNQLDSQTFLPNVSANQDRDLKIL